MSDNSKILLQLELQNANFDKRIKESTSNIDLFKKSVSSVKFNNSDLQHHINLLKNQAKEIKGTTEAENAKRKVIQQSIEDLNKQKLANQGSIVELNRKTQATKTHIDELKKLKTEHEQGQGAISKFANSLSISSLAGNAYVKIIEAAAAGFMALKSSIADAYDEFLKFDAKTKGLEGTFNTFGQGSPDSGKTAIFQNAKEAGSSPVEMAEGAGKLLPILGKEKDTLAALNIIKAGQIALDTKQQDLIKASVAWFKLYGKEVKELPQFLNQLAIANKYVGGGVKEITANLATVFARTAQAGIGYKEATITLAAMKNVLGSASDAQVAYTQAIANVEAPAVRVRKTLNDLGVGYGAAKIDEAGGMLGYIRKLKEAIETLEPAQQKNILNELFKDKRANKGIQGLFALDSKNNPDPNDPTKSRLQGMIDESKSNNEALEKLYDKSIEKIDNKLKTMKQSVTNNFTELLIFLEPYISKGLDLTVDGINIIAGFFSDIGSIVQNTIDTIKDMDPDGYIIGFLGIFVKSVADILSSLIHSGADLINEAILFVQTMIKVWDLITTEIAQGFIALVDAVHNYRKIWEIYKNEGIKGVINYFDGYIGAVKDKGRELGTTLEKLGENTKKLLKDMTPGENPLEKGNVIQNKPGSNFQENVDKFFADLKNGVGEGDDRAPDLFDKSGKRKLKTNAEIKGAKQEILDKYDPLINQAQSNTNNTQSDAADQDLTKIQALRKESTALLNEIKIYQEKAAAYKAKIAEGFNFNTEYSEITKKISEIQKKIRKINRDVQKEITQTAIDEAQLNSKKVSDNLKNIAAEKGLSESQILNNEIFANKKSLEVINKFLANKSALTREQIKKLNDDKESLENENRQKEKQKSDARFNEQQKDDEREITRKLKTSKTLVDIGLKSDKESIEEEIDSNNKKIALRKKELAREKNKEKKEEIKDSITDLENSNLEIDYKKWKLIRDEKKADQERDLADNLDTLNLLHDARLISEEEYRKEIIKSNELRREQLEAEKREYVNRLRKDGKTDDFIFDTEEYKNRAAEIKSLSNTIKLQTIQNLDEIRERKKSDRELSIQNELEDLELLHSTKQISEEQYYDSVLALNKKKLTELEKDRAEIVARFTAAGKDKSFIIDTDEYKANAQEIEKINREIISSQSNIIEKEKEFTRSVAEPLLNAFEQVFPGISKIFDYLIDKNEEFRNVIIKTGSEIAQSLGVLAPTGSSNPQPTSHSGTNTKGHGNASEGGFKAVSAGAADAQLKVLGVTATVQQLSESLQAMGKFATKAFGEGFNSAQDAKDATIDLLKSMPGGTGAILGPIVGTFNDIEKAKKAHDSSIKQSEFELQSAILNSGEDTTEKKNKQLDLEYQNNLRALKDENLGYEQYNLKKQKLDVDYHNNKIKLDKEAAQITLDAQRGLIDAQISLTGQYYDYEAKKAQINYQYVIDGIEAVKTASTSSDPLGTFTNLLLAANDRKNKALYDLDSSFAQHDLELNSDLEDSILNLQVDSFEKQKKEAWNAYNRQVKDLQIQYNNKLINAAEFNSRMAQYANELTGKLNQIEFDHGQKIQDLNQSNYDALKDLITKESQKRIDFLKSEIQKELDLVRDKNKKLKELEENRLLDQDQKQKRLQAFNTAVANTKKDGAFFRSNELDFNTGDGKTTGNETQRNNIENDYNTGAISFAEYSQKKAQLGLEKYIYYAKKAEKIDDPQKKADYIAKARSGQAEYYEFIFDKNQEQINAEAEQAAKKIPELKQQLSEEEKVYDGLVDSLDKKFRDSSGNMRKDYVTDFRGFITDIQPDITKIGVDLYNALRDAKKKFAANDEEYGKITNGSSGTGSSGSTSAPARPYGTETTPKAGETWDEMIARFKREDAEVSKSNGFTSGGSTSNTSPTPSQNTIYGTSTTPNSGETWDEMIARFKREDAEVTKNLRGYAGGGVSSGPASGYPVMLHGTEGIAPEPDIIDMWNYIKDTTKAGYSQVNNNSASTTVINQHTNNINLYGVNLANQQGLVTVVETTVDNVYRDSKKIKKYS